MGHRECSSVEEQGVYKMVPSTVRLLQRLQHL